MDKFFYIKKIPGSVTLTVLMSIYALVLALVFKSTDRWICLSAMLLSSVGDVVLCQETRTAKKLGSKGFTIGGTCFAFAHLLYSVCYYVKISNLGYKIVNGGFYAAIAISVVALVVIFIMGLKKKNTVLAYVGAVLYLCLITCASSMIFSYAISSSGIAILALVGSLSFFISDYIIGISRFSKYKKFDFLIWWFYPIGQILVITFG